MNNKHTQSEHDHTQKFMIQANIESPKPFRNISYIVKLLAAPMTHLLSDNSKLIWKWYKDRMEFIMKQSVNKCTYAHKATFVIFIQRAIHGDSTTCDSKHICIIS